MAERPYYVERKGVVWSESPKAAVLDAWDVDETDYGDIERTDGADAVFELATDADGDVVQTDIQTGELLKAESEQRRPYDGQCYCEECGRGYRDSPYSLNTECDCGAELPRETDPRTVR